MRVLLLVAQLAAATHRPIDATDSAALHNHVKDVEFQYLMDWRYLWQKEMHFVANDRRNHPLKAPPNYSSSIDLRWPQGLGCAYESNDHSDFDPHNWMAHLIRTPNRLKLSLCPGWSKPNWIEPPDERKSIDASLTQEGFPPTASDSARLIRQPVLRLLDSAAKLLAGDGWIAGQRVRLHLDQAETGAATKAAADCRATMWWCSALLGYVEFTTGNVSKASATFDRARAAMPDSLRCVWDDASMFFVNSGRQAYEGLSCAQRDSVNDRVWWLADPLFIEAGNERRTEHFARQVLIELHAALDADERFDWRDGYQGPALREMLLRYGWPTQIITWETRPLRWVSGNTHSLFLGDTTITVVPNLWCNGMEVGKIIDSISRKRGDVATPHWGANCDADPLAPIYYPRCYDGEIFDPQPVMTFCNPFLVVPGIKYWGPQFHTVPLWNTVLDPFHATDEGWDLAPQRDAGNYWDTSWWPTEFYRRDAGPLVPLSTQIAFFRRQKTAILVAAMSWDTITYITRPLDRMVGAAIVSTGPYTPLTGVQDTMSGRFPHPLVTQVASGPALLGVEMVPRGTSGPAARTRFGIAPPPPLGAVTRGELALSDVVLGSAKEGEAPPETFVAMLPRMLGSTVLRDPKRASLFWELYGLGTGDTVNVELRIIRKDDANALQHLGALLGIGSKGDDSVVVKWTEPRPGEPTATLEGGVTIRPRGLVVDMSSLSAGQYSLAIAVQRGAGPAVITTRAFRIERR